MSQRRTPEDVERRLAEVKRLMREHHAGITADDLFAQRVVARLPDPASFSFEWAVRRVLPVSVAVAMALTLVVAVTGRTTGRTATSQAASASSSASSSGASSPSSSNDPLDWLLENRDSSRETR